MKEAKIKVLALLPLELPKEIELDNTLEAMQNFVGGLIKCITLSDTGSEVTLVCNDEGKLLGLPLNRPLWDGADVLAGPGFLAGCDSEGNLTFLPQSAMDFYKEKFRAFIEKIKKRKLNYAAMRADGELPREEYQALCKQADDEIARLEQELKALSPAPEPQTVSSDLKAIYDFLSQKVDVHGARLAPELIDQFVEVVTPFADYSYRWKLNTGCKKSKEERTDLMAVSEKPILTFTIDFETAKRYWEASKMPHQFRRAAWTDLTVEVYLCCFWEAALC